MTSWPQSKVPLIQFSCRFKTMLYIPFTGKAPVSTFKKALLLFIGSDTPDWQEISSGFDVWAKENVVSPNILLLSRASCAQMLIEQASDPDGGTDRYELLQRQSQVYIGAFDSNGTITVVKAGETQTLPGNWNETFRTSVETFIQTESTNESLVVAAPLGFYFSKLSNRYSSHFIRAESLLRCTFTIELLALRLLEAFSQYCESQKYAGKVRILLDSMVIWPVAQALSRMHRSDEEFRYVIQSFKSYEGLETNTLSSGPAFVIISASTSGGLERKLYKDLGNRQVEVWTLLGLEPEINREEKENEDIITRRNEVFSLPRKLKGAPALGGLREKFEPDVGAIPPGTDAVKVIGERFLSHNVRPKLVRLVHKTLADKHKVTLADFAKECAVLSARRRLDGKAWWSVSFDLRALVKKYTEEKEGEPSILENWLKNYGFPGPVLIVHPLDTDTPNVADPGQNELLAQRAKGMLLSSVKDPSSVRVVNHTELDRPDTELREFLSHAGVIVIAPIISNGFLFKQISASLRSVKPRGPRLYISLAVLPESEARFSELKADLESNADDSAYRFKFGVALPIGKIDETIGWQSEYTLLKEVREDCEEKNINVPDLFSQRIDCFTDGRCLDGERTFLPNFKGESLGMTPGFLLWASKDPIFGNKLGGSVLFTVAAFLEACRTARSGANDTSLISGLFQQTLISPANFTRFNDPAIQAALLRCAYPSEMNYAASIEASHDMCQLIKKLIQLHDAPSGAALGEFLLALAVGRLTLERNHLTDLIAATNELNGWLGILASKISRPE